MLLDKSSIFITLALIIAVLCNARAIDHDLFDIQLEGHSANIEKRQTLGRNSGGCAVYPCSPNSCTKASCLRPRGFNTNVTESDDEFEESFRLVKRIFANPISANAIGNYISRQAQRTTAIKLVPDDGSTFCTQLKFEDLPRSRSTVIGMGDTELTGCTILSVVSARAVYMCHIWEDLNFEMVNTRLPPGSRAQVGFQPVLNLISGTGNTDGATGPALDPSLYSGEVLDTAWAFIMTPRNRRTGDDAKSQEHVPEIRRLAALVQNLIPMVGILMYNYWAVPNNQEYPHKFQGTTLWEYDSNADGQQTANWRLWFEGLNENGRALGQNVTAPN